MSWLSDKIESLDDPAAPVVSTRAVDTTFAPHATKHTFVSYTVELSCDEGETSSVELRCDAASPPTVARCSALLTNGAANGDAVTTRHQLTHIVPPGHNVRLVVAGTGATVTVAHQVEIVIS